MSRTGSSYSDSVEFLYLLNQCLLNYGSLIVLELVKSALPSSHQPSQLPSVSSVPPAYEEVVRAEDHGHPEKPTIPMGPPPLDPIEPREQASPRFNAKRSLPAESPDRHGNDSLRQHVASMKCDLANDSSILPWSEVAGLATAKLCLEEFAAFFSHFPHLTSGLRHQSASGILLFGPQGTGKTLLVKSYAQKYGYSFYDIRASAIMSKYVGESEKFINALFEEVRVNAPAILLLDECDGLLCNPAADSSMSQSYRLLQNELKNQWSDLIYSKAKVIVIGATNKPQDIDMDGFGRRLGLKIYVNLPNGGACQQILEGALSEVRHEIDEEEFTVLGNTCAERGLSGFDIDCVVEGVIRKGMRAIMTSRFFREVQWNDERIVIPCLQEDADAQPCGWQEVEDKNLLSYCPIGFEDLKKAIARARPTVDADMVARHEQFASQYSIQDLE